MVQVFKGQVAEYKKMVGTHTHTHTHTHTLYIMYMYVNKRVELAQWGIAL